MPSITLRGGVKVQRPIQDPEAVKRFGNFLRSIRQHRGMTQKDVAYKLGIKQQSSVCDWEYGRSAPSVPEVLYGLIDIFTLDEMELSKFYDLGDDVMKKALRNDERVQKMLELRKQGLTNKQIAQEIGCGVSTVYENIGKRSMDVRKAAEQNKPCPVPEEKKPEPIKVETKPIETVDAKDIDWRKAAEQNKKTIDELNAKKFDNTKDAIDAVKHLINPDIHSAVDDTPVYETLNVEAKPIEPEQPKEEAKGRSWEETKAHIQALPPIELPKRKLGTLSIRKEVRILELDGVACNYRVNTGTGDIELVSFDDRASLVEGLLDKTNLDAMIGELQMIRTLL